MKRAASLRMVYFSQMREMDEGVTLRRALAPDSDSVVYQGRVVHVASYATKFLFTSEQLNQPVERLSGGERARVLIAKLMLEAADVLLLDEPTNDLDIQTLEILEESLLEYAGALILVTHDRYMLDRVSTVVLGLDGKGGAETVCGLLAVGAVVGRVKEETVAPGAQEGCTAGLRGRAGQVGGRRSCRTWSSGSTRGLRGLVEAADERLEAARDRVEEPSGGDGCGGADGGAGGDGEGAGGGGWAVCSVGGVDGEGGVGMQELSELPEAGAGFLEPMLCEPVKAVPAGDGWVYETKLDGYQAAGGAAGVGEGVTLLTRNNNSLNRKFFYIAEALDGFVPEGTVLDGELVALDERGRPSFTLLQFFPEGSAACAVLRV